MKTINNNIPESYTSFEVSKLLYDKGFNMITSESNFYGKRGESNYVKFFNYWVDYTLIHQKFPDIFKNEIKFDKTATNSSDFGSMEAFYLGNQLDVPYYHSPTTQLAMEWVRVNFGILIYVATHYEQGLLVGYDWVLERDENSIDFDPISSDKINQYMNPQETINEGLLYVLKNLI